MKNKKNNDALQIFLSILTHNMECFSIERKVLNEDFVLHFHNYFEIELIYDGTGKEIINHKPVEIKKGLFYILKPTDIHEYKVSKPIKVCSLCFDYSIIPLSFAQFFMDNKNSNFIFYLDDKRFNDTAGILNLIENEYNVNDVYSEQNIKNLLTILLTTFLRENPEFNSHSDVNEPMMLALNYINCHFFENPSLSQVAQIINYNDSYFSTLFKQYTGKNYTNYLLDLKIEHAKKLLKNNPMPIINACMSCGFNSISNFNRCFKKMTGMSPTEYKKINKEL